MEWACCSASRRRSAGGDPPEVRDAHHPRGAGKDHRFAPARSSVRVDVGPRKEQDGERSIHDVQQFGRPTPECESGKTDQPLYRGKTGHHQVARAKTAGHLRVAKVSVGAPDGEHESEDEKCPRAHAVKEYEYLHHTRGLATAWRK